MSSEITSTRMTAEEFYEWASLPENRDRHFELDRGEVVAMPPPSERHGLICGNVSFLLNLHVRQRRQGYVLTNDTGIILQRHPDTVRGPDVVLFTENKGYDQLNPKFTEGIPALAVEVLSPSDRIGKVTRRIGQLLEAGVRLVWLIDPESRDVTVYRPSRDDYVVEGDQESTGEDVLPGFRCRVAEFFQMQGEAPGQEQPGG